MIGPGNRPENYKTLAHKKIKEPALIAGFFLSAMEASLAYGMMREVGERGAIQPSARLMRVVVYTGIVRGRVGGNRSICQ
jgi:hypothetical protein